MNQETENKRELRFVCPKCGNDWLQTRGERYMVVERVYDDGDFEWGHVLHEEVTDFLCGRCGHVLEFDGEEDLAEWLIAHCNQEDSEPGQPGEHDSRMPPVDES